MLDDREADLSGIERALCDYAIRLTLAPGEMGEGDIEALRTRGLSDEQITIATHVVAYFNAINRIADALGVDPESWMTMPKNEWLARKRRDWPSNARA